MTAKWKSHKIEREILIMNYDEEMLREVEMEDKNEPEEVPILFIKTRENLNEKSLFDEIAEANLAPKICSKCPDEIAESGLRAGQKRGKSCWKRNETLKPLKVGASKNQIPLNKLIQLSTYVVKMTRILNNYNGFVFCSFSSGTDPHKFDDMKPLLRHIAQNLTKVLRNYGGQNDGQLTGHVSGETDIEVEKSNPKDRLTRVFNHMVNVKEYLPDDMKTAQSEFLSGLTIFVRMLENYPFHYFYENRLILPPENTQIEREPHGIHKKISNFARNLHLNPLKIVNLTKNVPQSVIIGGAVALLVVVVGLYFNK